MRFHYCLGSGNGTRSLRAGDFVLAGSFRGGGTDAQNDFGEETSGPKGAKLPRFTYEINK